MQSDQTPIIVTGPSGSGKSHWIQEYAQSQKKQLITCPCRKDRTLREGRQKLHVLGKRREAVILWLEGADDLTPEAQAFLRRILETHSSDVQFVLECRDPGKLQEPIRSRCQIFRKTMPTKAELEGWIMRSYKGIDIGLIFEYLNPDEYSYRRIKHCIFLQLQSPDLWNQTVQHRREERRATLNPKADLIPAYQSKAYNPEAFLRTADMRLYGECLERGGSVWAFLSSALSSDQILNTVLKE